MKKVNDDEMRAEYDFSGGIRGKYAKAYAKGTNLVLLDPDIAALYKDSKTVNKALRLLAELARKQSRSSKDR